MKKPQLKPLLASALVLGLALTLSSSIKTATNKNTSSKNSNETITLQKKTSTEKTKYIWLMDPGTKIMDASCGGESEIDDVLSLQIYKNNEEKLNTELKFVGVTYGNSKKPQEAEPILKAFTKDIKTVVGAKTEDSKDTELSRKIKEITEKEKISIIITGPATDLKGLPEKNYENIEKIITSFPIADDYEFGNFLFDDVLPLIGWRFDQWNLNLDSEAVKDLLQKGEGKIYFYTMNVATALTKEDIEKIENKKIQFWAEYKHQYHYEKFGQKGYFPWDSLALAILADHEANLGIFKYRKEKLDVKGSGFWHKLEPSEKGYEAIIAYDIDKAKFKKFLISGL